MTCIVGIVDRRQKRVVLGADSAGVNGLDITIRKDPKIFQVGDFIIACTSSFRMIQLLMYSLQLPGVKPKDNINKYMCTDFINAVRQCFKDGGYLMTSSQGDEIGGIFLVGYKNRLFRVDADFQVGESTSGVEACGCGADYAMGAIYAMKSTGTAEVRVTMALAAAANFNAGVCRPFRLMTTIH